ncbi:heterokaryon incompatibility protein-domain-containing protein [Scleroderma yunnanense]
MQLINIQAFIERERVLNKGEEVDCRTKVLEFRDDETTNYAILSHRWMEQEDERDEVRQCVGYRKILDCCEHAKGDGYDWLWVDTCCIDKRSSTELSEAINSMYRWYKNSQVCYAYLHDVPGSSFPTTSDKRTYPNSNGWPEWFSRGWTLQEMIAPSNVQFFNNDWQPIGDKKTLAKTLSHMTRVPQHILTGGLSSDRPCVAQIMSWAADRMTTRVEDRAYSLLGLLDVNMPMLYGEGKKAFHRLQLEIIRMSNDQSIFAWGSTRGILRSGSILADDPSSFRDCDNIELTDHDKFIQSLKDHISAEELHSIEEDQFGTFPITNRGIQIWMLLRPFDGSDSVFEAWLPCCINNGLSNRPVRITLVLWKSNYCRYFMLPWEMLRTKGTIQLRQIYLRYQDTPPHSDVTYEIDDSEVIKNGTGNKNTFTLTGTDPLCVKVYSDDQTRCLFSVGFGQYFGRHWIHFVYQNPTSEYSWMLYPGFAYDTMLARGPEHAQSMPDICSRDGCYGRLWFKYARLPGSTWILRTSCIFWESSKNCGGAHDPSCDMRGLMMFPGPRDLSKRNYTLLVDGVSMEFWEAPIGTKLGDYGHSMHSGVDFRREGNIFTDFRSLATEVVITPRQHKVDDKDGHNAHSNYVKACTFENYNEVSVTLYEPLGLSLPSNYDFNSSLASLSNRLTNKYLVVRVIQCATVSYSESWAGKSREDLTGSFTSDPTIPLCIIAKPFVWHQDESADDASMEWLATCQLAKMRQ